MRNVSLSIVIPCRDRQIQLAELLSEIEDQAYRMGERVEVIVIDDGSEPEIRLGSFQYISPVLIRRTISGGAQSARRAGLKISKGRTLHFHDSDDLIGPGWLHTVASAFDADTALDVLITSRVIQSEANGPARVVHPRIVNKLKDEPAKLRHYLKFENAIGPIGGITFRRSIVLESDFLDTPASQDWLLYDEVLARATRIKVVRNVHFIVRTFGKDRISDSPLRRVKGFLYASKVRFKRRRARRGVAIMYCAVAGPAIRNIVKVRNPWLWRALCRWMALSRSLSRLTGLKLHSSGAMAAPISHCSGA